MEGKQRKPKMETPQGYDLLRKILELEAGHAHLKQEMSRLKYLGGAESNPDSTRRGCHSASPQLPQFPGNAAAWNRASGSVRHPLLIENGGSYGTTNGGGGGGGRKAGNSRPAAVNLTNSQYLNILQFMGQSVYIYDLSGRIIFWNRHAEILHGYSAAEALGEHILKLIVIPRDLAVAYNIIHRVSIGESWTGLFPIKNSSGKMINVVATVIPFYDDNGSLIGITSVSCDSRPFRETEFSFSPERQPETDSSVFSRPKNAVSVKLGLDPQTPLQTAIASKISNWATKVRNKVKSRIRTSESCVDCSDHKEYATWSGARTPKGESQSLPLGVFRPSYCKSTVKISTDSGDGSEGKPASQNFMNLMAKKGISWPINTEPSGSSSSSAYVNSTSGSSSSGSTGSSPVNRIGLDTDCVAYEILWEELTVGEQIGQGCCGTVYHGLWYGSDVAIKIFPKLEYSDDVIISFKQEVSLMKRLWHPNVLLFMGAVTSPQRLCIVTEFLSRVSLATEECCKIRLEMTCSYGFRYCTRHELSSSLQSAYRSL